MKIIKQTLHIIIFPDKDWYISWRKNNTIHREDGPATIWIDREKVYHLDNKFYSEDDYWKEVHENY